MVGVAGRHRPGPFTLAGNRARPYDCSMKCLAVLLLAAGSLAMNVEAAEKADRNKAHLTAIPGIDLAVEAKLNRAGINNVNDLLAEGATRQARDEMATRSGLSAGQLLKFVHCADLFRIKGIGGQTVALLDAAGVSTVAELSRSNASNLHAKLQQVSDAKKAIVKLPTEKELVNWIDEAKALPKKVVH